jgi:hypothetical protein
MRNVRDHDFFAWCLSFCFASVALTASAQSQALGQNPVTNAPVVIPPDVQVQPQPSVQTQPSTDIWDRWGIQKVSENDDWTRHFRIGAMVALNVSANFNVKNPITFSSKNAANGIYDDGYVRTDNTGNAGNLTSNWGYDNLSQVVDSTLQMHSAKSFSPGPTGGTSSESGDSAFVGFDMAYGGNLWDWGRARIGWELGFGLLPINIKDNLSLNGTLNQNVYSFDIPSSTTHLPVPGYQGGPNGGPWLGSNRTQLADSSSGNVNLTGSRTLDVMLYTVRLGPSVYWDLNQYLGLSVGAGPAVGIVSGSLQYNETIATTRYTGQIDATDLVYGGYVNATLMYHVPKENGDLYLGVQYMSLGNATISGGGREGQLNLGGQVYITAGINWPF